MNEIELLKEICKTNKDSVILLEKLTREEKEIISSFLYDGILVLNKAKQYMVSPFFNSYIGKVVSIKKNFIFVKVEEFEKDIYVKGEYTGEALINDIVKVWVIPSTNDGFIEKIEEHANKEIVGKVSYKGKPHIIPTDKNIDIPIYLEEESVIASVNDLVVVKVTSFKHPLKGKVIKVIGNINTPGSDILAKVYEAKVPFEFSEATNEELKNIPISLELDNENTKERLDLRNELIVTIDGEDAKDFDDAINVKKTKNGYTLGVHIADVTHYVKEGNPLDRDALARGTSIYLADRVIPMLPFKLSNGICSLNPHEDRLTMSCIMEINEEGGVESYNITPSIINSKYRLTYKEVNDLLHNNKTLDAQVSEMLLLAFELSKKIRKERETRGAIDLNVDEAKLIIGDDGKVIEIQKRVQDDGEKLIEDFMIVANESVASYVNYMELPFIYRIHDYPAQKKLSQLVPLLNALGYTLNAKNGIHPHQIQTIVNKSKGTPLQDVVSQLVLRSLAKAKYSEDNIGHFGLGSDIYTHFTSPIRRYPDLLVHRLLKLYREDVTKIDLDALLNKISDIAKANSLSERKAIELERTVTAMKMAEYMLSHIGEEFDGVVSGMIDSGLFIMLDNLVEGMVRFEKIDYDYFSFDAKKMQCIGRGSKKIISLGQKFRIIVLNASKESGKVEFEIADTYGFMNLPSKEKKVQKRKN